VTTSTLLPTELSAESRSLALPEAVSAKARAILDEGTPEATRRAYRGDLAYWEAWARAATGEPLPWPVPTALALAFVAEHVAGLEPAVEASLLAAGVKARPGPHRVATVTRRLAALSAVHRAAGLPSPAEDSRVRTLLSKARRRARDRGETPRKALALHLDRLERLLAVCGDDLRGLRDRALLLFAFASGGRRRSEVAAARIEDLEPVEDGFLYRLPGSKTDPEGRGVELPVLGRAGRALAAWLAAGALAEGRIFRSIDRHGNLGTSLTPKAVALILKRRAGAAGLDPDAVSGHSLRSGFVTEAGRQGKPLPDAMALSTHRSVAVAVGYHQAGAVLENSTARLAG
jgi:integrase